VNGLKHLIWIRHGRSYHNELNGGILQNDAPNPELAYAKLVHHHAEVADDSFWQLTGRGLMQARFASEPIQEYVAPLNPAVFIASPFTRAHETGSVVFPHVEWATDLRVQERDWGNTTHGITCVHQYREKHAEMLAGADTNPHFIPGLLGESVQSRVPGVRAFLAELDQRYPGGTAVVSSHGEMSKVVRYVLAGASPEIWPAICQSTGMGNLMFLHFTQGPSGQLDLVKRFNPLVHPMVETGWQHVNAAHIST
jgi:broad specificity phosphatase PhoE